MKRIPLTYWQVAQLASIWATIDRYQEPRTATIAQVFCVGEIDGYIEVGVLTPAAAAEVVAILARPGSLVKEEVT